MEYNKIEILPQLCQGSDVNILKDTAKLENYVLELKFDGTRLLPHIGDSSITLFTRNGVSELSKQYPVIVDAVKSLNLPTGTILDGELVFYTPDGNVEFQSALITHETMIARKLTPKFVVFDILKYDGVSCTDMPWNARRVFLETRIVENNNIAISKVYYNPNEYNALFENEVNSGREGVVLKQKTSKYMINKRNSTWLKCKRRDTLDCVVMGMTKGDGKYSDTFGSLILGNVINDGIKIIGYCSGMDDVTRAQLFDTLMNMEEKYYNIKSTKPIIKFVEPKIVVEVAYMEQTEYGMLRHPAFVQIRHDKNIEIPKSLYTEKIEISEKNANCKNNIKKSCKASVLSDFF